MLKPLSQLNQFFKLAPEKTLSGSDQLVWLHLFNLFNRQHWPETILVRDAELLELINWHESNGKPASIDTIRKAKARLKKKGFIDFKATAAGTEYRMPQLYPYAPPADTPYDPSERPYIRPRQDALDVEDAKTKEKGDASADAFKVWASEMPRPLTASEKYELADFEESYGFEKVKEAIIATRRERYYPTFADFKKILLKGGEKNERDNEPYTKPQYAENAPWQRF